VLGGQHIRRSLQVLARLKKMKQEHMRIQTVKSRIKKAIAQLEVELTVRRREQHEYKKLNVSTCVHLKLSAARAYTQHTLTVTHVASLANAQDKGVQGMLLCPVLP